MLCKLKMAMYKNVSLFRTVRLEIGGEKNLVPLLRTMATYALAHNSYLKWKKKKNNAKLIPKIKFCSSVNFMNLLQISDQNWYTAESCKYFWCLYFTLSLFVSGPHHHRFEWLNGWRSGICYTKHVKFIHQKRFKCVRFYQEEEECVHVWMKREWDKASKHRKYISYSSRRWHCISA